MRIGVVGHGVVGRAVARLFVDRSSCAVSVYDKFLPTFASKEHKDAINECDLAFICVPTPMGEGNACDVSAVEECVDWVSAPMCIRSTIAPGTVDRLVAQTGKGICFSPEYLGEQPNHPWTEEGACGFMIVGGTPPLRELVISAYAHVKGFHPAWYRTDARSAELCKYMENCFLATKVAFVNQFYDIAQEIGVDFEELRTLWLADPRIGESHTLVTPERGFAGKCLPKDLGALVALMSERGGAPLLEAIFRYNAQLRRTSSKASIHYT